MQAKIKLHNISEEGFGLLGVVKFSLISFFLSSSFLIIGFY